MKFQYCSLYNNTKEKNTQDVTLFGHNRWRKKLLFFKIVFLWLGFNVDSGQYRF